MFENSFDSMSQMNQFLKQCKKMLYLQKFDLSGYNHNVCDRLFVSLSFQCRHGRSKSVLHANITAQF